MNKDFFDRLLFSSRHLGLLTDLHFGKNREDRWEKIYDDLLDWIIKEFHEREVKQVLITGDVFDGHFSKSKEKGTSFKILHYVSNWFEKLAEEFEVIVFSGNHDLYYKEGNVSACSIFKNKESITLLEDTVVYEYADKKYQLVPWSCEMSEQTDGMFCHMDIETFKLNGFKVADHGFSSKELFKYTDKVISGHYHWYQTRDYQKGKKNITYLGTANQLDWGEAGKQSFIHVYDLQENEISDQIENTFSPQHIKIQASKLDKQELKEDFVEVVWDIEKTDEESKRVSEIIENGGVATVRFNNKNLQKQKSIEYEKITSSMDADELIVEAVELLETNADKEKVLDKGQEILKRVKK